MAPCGSLAAASGERLPTVMQRLPRCDRLPEIGVNFIDTADSYGPDVSEKLIREALHPYEGLLIATKAGLRARGRTSGRPTDAPPI